MDVASQLGGLKTVSNKKFAEFLMGRFLLTIDDEMIMLFAKTKSLRKVKVRKFLVITS